MAYGRGIPGQDQIALQARRPFVMGFRGAVACPHYLASEAGLTALKKGGHAVDSCIAMNAVLSVVYDHMAGLGGDCFAQVFDKKTGKVEAINGSGRSGERFTADVYRDKGLDEIPRRGPLAAVTVPGTVETWWQMHQRYGKLPWKDLMEPAIEYARDGFPITMKLTDYIRDYADMLKEHETAAKIFMPNGSPVAPGDRVRQPDLARTFEAVAQGGAEEFYRGETAKKMVKSLQAAGGLLTEADFAEHTSDWVEPLSTTYRGITVTELPPNTQGLTTLLILNILENFDLNEFNDGSADFYHLMTEATKLAFVDRDEWVADPNFLDAPLDEILSKEHAKERAETIDMASTVSPEDIQAARPLIGVAGDTVYICAADSEGNLCSQIQSVYHEFGSAFMPEGTGVLLQNRGTFFKLDEDNPNLLEPRKRVFHTIIPAMAMKDGKPFMAFGSMGGEGQPQTQSAILTRMVDYGYDIQEAIEAPRWLYGRTWGEESKTLKIESRIPDHVGMELERRGHAVEWTEQYSEKMGHAHGVVVRDGERFEAGSDPRSDGAALAF